MPEDKVLCQTPTPGKKGTRIDRWKYDLVRQAILDSLPANEEGIPFSKLADLVAQRIPENERDRLGSVSWYTTTVKLDLEVRGEIERVPGVTPQHLRLAS